MKTIPARLHWLLLLCAVSLNGNAQSPQRPPPSGDFPAHVGGTYDIGSDLAKERRLRGPISRPPYREDRLIKEGPLAPAPGDRTAFRDFLRAPDTGLIRLLPRDQSFGQGANAKINLRGGGAYYSFARLTHEYNYGSDLELSQNKLLVGFAGADYGMMRLLGDVPLDEVTLADPRVLFMATYSPPALDQDARAEARKFRQGLTVEGVHYKSMLPVEVSGTYLLRSVVYGSSDVLVAFRVVRRDPDDSVIIAWKLLQKYLATNLIRTQ